MRRNHGFGAIMAIVILVILATLAAAIIRLGNTQQTSFAQDVVSAGAAAAARSGGEWGLWQTRHGIWTTCANQTRQLDLRAETGVWVTVTCDSTAYNDGETAPGVPRVIRIFVVEATACLSTTACPDNAAATSPAYVERRRRVMVSD